jgi:hypothetical protein
VASISFLMKIIFTEGEGENAVFIIIKYVNISWKKGVKWIFTSCDIAVRRFAVNTELEYKVITITLSFAMLMFKNKWLIETEY